MPRMLVMGLLTLLVAAFVAPVVRLLSSLGATSMEGFGLTTHAVIVVLGVVVAVLVPCVLRVILFAMVWSWPTVLLLFRGVLSTVVVVVAGLLLRALLTSTVLAVASGSVVGVAVVSLGAGGLAIIAIVVGSSFLHCCCELIFGRKD